MAPSSRAASSSSAAASMRTSAAGVSGPRLNCPGRSSSFFRLIGYPCYQLSVQLEVHTVTAVSTQGPIRFTRRFRTIERRGRSALKRNIVVLGITLLILATFAWAGWANYEYRKQAAEKMLANAGHAELIAAGSTDSDTAM